MTRFLSIAIYGGILILCITYACEGRSQGAPPEACKNMIPLGHPDSKADLSKRPPYVLTAEQIPQSHGQVFGEKEKFIFLFYKVFYFDHLFSLQQIWQKGEIEVCFE
jgi:hypothetical protein